MFARSRQYIADAKVRLEMPDQLRPIRDRLANWAPHEMRAVDRLCRSTRYRPVARIAAIISWLGNGMLYLLLGLPILFLVPGSARAVAASCGAILIAHLVYPWLKIACARERPCTLNTELQPLIKTLDKLSFPSGHMMTLAAAATPVLQVCPDFWSVALALWVAMGWSRIACAHHYPSDVLAGTCVGTGIAMPLSWALI